MARTFARIFAFMLAVVGIYAYVGILLPQFEEHPPKKRVITVQTPPDELVAIGQELTRGKGGCLVCHKDAETGNVRGPGTIGLLTIADGVARAEILRLASLAP